MQPPSFYCALPTNHANESSRSRTKRQESSLSKQETPQKRNYNNLSTIALNEEIQAMSDKLLEKEKELIAEKQKTATLQRVLKQYKEQIHNALITAKEITLDIQQNPSLLLQKCTELCLAHEELRKQNKLLEESIKHETLVSEENRTRAQIMKQVIDQQLNRDSVAALSKGDDQTETLLELTELKVENEGLKNALEEAQNKCNELQLLVEEKDDKNVMFEKKLVAMAQTSETLRLENESLVEEKNRLLEYIDNMPPRENLEKIQNQNDFFKTQNEKLQKECMELGEKLRQLEERNQVLVSEREHIMAIIRERELEINDNIARLNAMKLENLDMKREMNINQENFTALTLTLSETQEELERALKKNRELEKEVTQLENYIEIMKVESKRAENHKIEDLKQKIQTLLQM